MVNCAHDLDEQKKQPSLDNARKTAPLSTNELLSLYYDELLRLYYLLDQATSS